MLPGCFSGHAFHELPPSLPGHFSCTVTLNVTDATGQTTTGNTSLIGALPPSSLLKTFCRGCVCLTPLCRMNGMVIHASGWASRAPVPPSPPRALAVKPALTIPPGGITGMGPNGNIQGPYPKVGALDKGMSSSTGAGLPCGEHCGAERRYAAFCLSQPPPLARSPFRAQNVTVTVNVSGVVEPATYNCEAQGPIVPHASMRGQPPVVACSRLRARGTSQPRSLP